MDSNQKNKNIILIVIDCLRSDAIFSKKSSAVTPNIKKLVEDGTSFPNTIAVATTTCPCFGSILTGLYPITHGIRTLTGYNLKPNLQPIVTLLKEKGYYLWAELNGPFARQDFGFKKYFDEFNVRSKNQTIHAAWWDEFLTKIRTQKKPWFLLFHIWSLHSPYQVPQNFNTKKYGKNKYYQALSAIDTKLKELIDLIKDDSIILLTGDHGEQLTNYEIERVIKAIFKIAAHKISLKFPKNKILRKIIFRTQRLYQLGHGYHVYDHLIKIPLIIAHQHAPKPKIIDKQVRQIDIMPTILNLAGINVPADITGKNLLAYTHNSKEPDRLAFIEACAAIIADETRWLEGIRTPEYKAVRGSFARDIPCEVYDLKKDPLEKKNIYKKDKEIARKLFKKIDQIKKSIAQEEFAGQKMDEKEVEKIKEQLKSLGYF